MEVTTPPPFGGGAPGGGAPPPPASPGGPAWGGWWCRAPPPPRPFACGGSKSATSDVCGSVAFRSPLTVPNCEPEALVRIDAVSPKLWRRRTSRYPLYRNSEHLFVTSVISTTVTQDIALRTFARAPGREGPRMCPMFTRSVRWSENAASMSNARARRLTTWRLCLFVPSSPRRW